MRLLENTSYKVYNRYGYMPCVEQWVPSSLIGSMEKIMSEWLLSYKQC